MLIANTDHSTTISAPAEQIDLTTARFGIPYASVSSSLTDFLDSVSLLEQEYKRVGYIGYNECAYHPLEAHPSSVTLGVRDAADKLLNRASMVLWGKENWCNSLPCAVQPEFAEQLQKCSEPTAEITRLAQHHKHTNLTMTRLLMDEIAVMSMALGLESVHIVCHPRHEGFYTTCYDAEPLARVDSYAGVQGNPGVLLKMIVDDFYFVRWAPKVLQNGHDCSFDECLQAVRLAYDSRIQSKEALLCYVASDGASRGHIAATLLGLGSFEKKIAKVEQYEGGKRAFPVIKNGTVY